MDSKKVNVLGWYNHGNIGDDSYKLAFPLVFHTNFEFIDKLTYPKDVCILGGGDVLGGYFLEQISCAKKRLALSISLSYDIKKETLDLFDLICVRDKKSFNIASEMGKKALLYPDFSFALTSHKQIGTSHLSKLFIENSLDHYQKVVGIVVNSNLLPTPSTPAYQVAAFDRFCFEIAQLADTTNASFVFIPFGKSIPTDDTISNGFIASKCKFWKKNLLIKENLSVQQTLDVIAACDLVISTRLHSSIFSCIANVPFIDITHNHKNAALVDDMNYSHVISYWDFNRKDLETLINTVSNKTLEIKEKLHTIAEENKIKLQELKSNVHLLQ